MSGDDDAKCYVYCLIALHTFHTQSYYCNDVMHGIMRINDMYIYI